MALISDLANATPTKSDILEIQRGQTSSNNVSVEQLMQLSAVENLAPAYDANAGVYAVGDFVSYDGTLYQCNTAIATPEAFDATKWTAVKVTEISSGASVVQLTAAQYDALSTTEKMNGSIYKLTDKAVMYCLDEEYHALKELTSAQYEALSVAEQNNGTLYIQTDAETTGSDIPVSSSSSETIEDMLDSLSATSTENIATQISNTYGVSNVMASIKKIGKIGVLSVQFTSTNAVFSGVCILTTSIKSNGQVNSALGGLQGGGFIQYNEDNFVIRCTATGGNYLCGQLVFQVL